MAQVQRQGSPTISVILPQEYSQRSCQRASACLARERENERERERERKRVRERASSKSYRVRVPCSHASRKTASKWQDLQQVQSSE